MAAESIEHQKQPLWRWIGRVVGAILLFCASETTCLSPRSTASTISPKFSPCGHGFPRHLYQSRYGRWRSQSSLFAFTNSYGRGAEIWPECNEVPIQLSESFPGGRIPEAARQILEQQQSSTANPNVPFLRMVVNNANTLERLTAAVAAAVLIGGFVPFADFFLAFAWNTYLWWLVRLAKAPRKKVDGTSSSVTAPNLPSLPPQGHIPRLVSNPLGFAISNSKLYQQWLDAGVFIGLWGPILLLSRYTLWAAASRPKRLDAATACARPLFWLCCQAMAEAVARNLLMPLPIRVLIPVSYNALRLGPLWAWATSSSALNIVGRLLAITNWMYGTTNLLAFLLPIASLRYLRAHFFAVEAERVHLREILDEGIL